MASGDRHDRITYKDFEEVFSHQIPKVGSLRSETLVIKKVREWMFTKQLPTKAAFERLCRSVERATTQSLRRVDLHKACIVNRVGLTAPEIDFLFATAAADGALEITLNHWTGKIYDDVSNPLQLIREVVHSQNLDVDDILFQMKIKLWDEPMDFIKF